MATTDEILREAKFVIAARPNDSAPSWARDGKTYSQKSALKIARSETQVRDKLRGGLQTSTVSGEG